MDEKNEIEDYSNFCSGWVWFAYDGEGHIGLFNNGGLRNLPQTVKSDRRVTERLAEYFFEEASDRCGYSIRDKVEDEFGGWDKIVNKQLFLETFAEIARKGIFTHKSQNLRNREEVEAAKQLGVFSPATQHIYDLDGTASYYLVAIPERPLHLTDLPSEIAEMVSRVRSPFPFGATTHFSEVETMKW